MYFDICPDAKELPHKQNQTIQLNGFTQTLFLFTDPDMREIQLENIQHIIEQAAGRARALREQGATVHIFCNFVIGDADKVIG
jgi:hypothetical protein